MRPCPGAPPPPPPRLLRRYRQERPPPSVTDEGVCRLSSLTRLERLVLSGCHVTEAGCSALCALRDSLSALHLAHCQGLEDRALWELRGLRGLRELALPGCAGVTDIGLAGLAKEATG